MVGMGWVNEGVEKGEAPHPKKTWDILVSTCPVPQNHLFTQTFCLG